MVAMSDSNVVSCPFYSVFRKFTVPLCDRLRSGIPLCVVSGFFEDWDEEFEQACMMLGEDEARVKFSKPVVEHCNRVVLSDVYLGNDSFVFKKPRCFFGGLCVRPAAQGFFDCTVDCSRRNRRMECSAPSSA